MARLTKTDNYRLFDKIHLRKEATKGLHELKVLDLFAGRNQLWKGFACARYYGIDKVDKKGINLCADNLKIISGLDLRGFNVIDCDSYGSPANQLVSIFKNPTLQKGTIIIYTYIKAPIMGLTKAVIDKNNLDKLNRFGKVLIDINAMELFYDLLNSYGITEVFEYTVKHRSNMKYYGFFKV